MDISPQSEIEVDETRKLELIEQRESLLERFGRRDSSVVSRGIEEVERSGIWIGSNEGAPKGQARSATAAIHQVSLVGGMAGP